VIDRVIKAAVAHMAGQHRVLLPDATVRGEVPA
jgi:hypothetical protein